MIQPYPRPWYGAVHLHTRISKDGDVSKRIGPRETLELARDHWNVDFALITDHSNYFWDHEEWEETIAAHEACHMPGSFISLPGYEWTNPVLGHWNIYFRKNRVELPVAVCRPLKDWPVCPTLPDWFAFLDDHLPREDYIIALNHPASPKCVANLDYYGERIRLIEVVNGEGVHTFHGAPGAPPSFVKYGNFVWDALVRGYRVGFLGALDYHEPHPACAQLTGVWAETLTREAIFHALYQRRTFATTGQRTSLDMTINGFPLGSVIDFNESTIDSTFPLNMNIRIAPAGVVTRVIIYDVNGIWKTWDRPAPDTNGVIQLQARFENEYIYDNLCNCYNRCFHLFVQEADGAMAWASPIYLRFNPNPTVNSPKT